MPATIVEHGKDISGTTAQRPATADIGQRFFDTTLKQMLVYSGTAWVSVDGAPAADVGAIPAVSGLALTREAGGVVHQTVLTLTAMSVTMTDAGAAGCHGTQKIYDFPEGRILVLGAHTDLVITAGAGGITDTAAVVGAIGTVAVGTGDATLTTTEADIVPSTVATLTGGIGDMEGINTAVGFHDGSATAKDAILNFAVPDAGSTANDTLAVSGTVTLTWVKLGDD